MQRTGSRPDRVSSREPLDGVKRYGTGSVPPLRAVSRKTHRVSATGFSPVIEKPIRQGMPDGKEMAVFHGNRSGNAELQGPGKGRRAGRGRMFGEEGR